MELWDAYDENFNLIDGVTLQEGETINYKWVSVDELKAISKTELVTTRMQGFIEELR